MLLAEITAGFMTYNQVTCRLTAWATESAAAQTPLFRVGYETSFTITFMALAKLFWLFG